MSLVDVVFTLVGLLLCIGLFWILECWHDLPFDFEDDHDEHEEL